MMTMSLHCPSLGGDWRLRDWARSRGAELVAIPFKRKVCGIEVILQGVFLQVPQNIGFPPCVHPTRRIKFVIWGKTDCSMRCIDSTNMMVRFESFGSIIDETEFHFFHKSSVLTLWITNKHDYSVQVE